MEKPNTITDDEFEFFLKFCVKYDIDTENEDYYSAAEKILASMEIAYELGGE